MSLSFIFPAALSLFVLLIPIWVLALVLPRRIAPFRFWSSLILRTLAVSALILALAGTQVGSPVNTLTTVFLLDRSASIAPAEQARAEEFIRNALAGMGADDQAAIVVFGENALVERAPSSERSFAGPQSPPVLSRTNIQDALQLGLSLLPANTNRRLVLLSDGGENAGNAREAARLAVARGVPISYFDLGSTSSADTYIASLSAPSTIRQNQEFTLVASIESTITQTAVLRVFGDEKVIFDEPVQLQAGINRFTVPVTPPSAGFQRYRAVIEPQNDTRPQNNQAETIVRVDGPARILLVEGEPGAARNLNDALAAAQIDPVVVAPEAMPSDLVELSNYAAVVLVNVPARSLPVAAMANLPEYVRSMGRGLVMIGGTQSFGLGGYGNTPVETALPVYMDVRDRSERPDLAIVYVLDKSASMDSCHCAGPSRETDGRFSGPRKVDLGKEAIYQSVAVLSERDTVGVVSFDEYAQWVVPAQQGIAPEAVQQAIAPIGPEGPTNVRAGLLAAEEMLAQVDAKIKHVILLTDGWSQIPGDPLEVARSMRDKGITLSVVAEGVGSAPYLQQLADIGGGRYFPTQRLEDIPQIFLEETIKISGNFLIETAFVPAKNAASPILNGIDTLPTLYGYNGSTIKETASTILSGVDDAPVLAQWQYGLGRAVAWTSDTKDYWGRDLIRWPEFPRFAAQLIGWVLPDRSSGQLVTEVQNNGAETTISVATQDERGQPRADVQLQGTLIDEAGNEQPIVLTQVGPGNYQASIATPTQGTYLLRIAEMQGERIITQESAALVVPYSPEYHPKQHNPALLAELAALSGGAPLAQPADAFAPTLHNATNTQEIALPLLYLALLLLPIDIIVRRLFLSTGRTKAKPK